MRKWVLPGLIVMLAGLLGSTWGMYHVINTGSCASGGNYVIARPCPPGTGLHIVALVAGILVGLIGAGIASDLDGTVAMWFGLFFVLIGADALVAIGGGGGLALGGLFLVMGLPAIGWALFQADGPNTKPVFTTPPG
jgi:hypothetical protein